MCYKYLIDCCCIFVYQEVWIHVLHKSKIRSNQLLGSEFSQLTEPAVVMTSTENYISHTCVYFALYLRVWATYTRISFASAVACVFLCGEHWRRHSGVHGTLNVVSSVHANGYPYKHVELYVAVHLRVVNGDCGTAGRLRVSHFSDAHSLVIWGHGVRMRYLISVGGSGTPTVSLGDKHSTTYIIESPYKWSANHRVH